LAVEIVFLKDYYLKVGYMEKPSGSVVIPEVLRKWMPGGISIISKR